MKVIGTAGHVDHGKSALVLALTGIDPDRLQEEKDRQMTIDLGFAWMTLPNGEEVGIVDVPGHRDFIENMLAGVGGLDAALLVIAADEGVMPQTREHLDILNLLDVKNGIIALTKTDLVEDPEWIELVKEEIRSLIGETAFAGAQIVPVSAKTGSGLSRLTEELANSLEETEPRVDRGLPRLPIDRAFTISGFGTVVTGTLLDGTLGIGDDIQILPASLNGRIRGLQTHKLSVEQAVPGSRTAVNITGVEPKRIQRGDVLAKPGTYSPTKMVDLSYHQLSSIQGSLKHDQVVKFFVGAAQTQARVRVIGGDKIDPGNHGWIQLILEDFVVTVRDDRFILRRPSPGMTLGGGRVIDPHPERKHRRFDSTLAKRFSELTRGDPADVFAHALQVLGLSKFEDAVQKSGMDQAGGKAALEILRQSGEIVTFDDHQAEVRPETIISHRKTWESLREEMERILKDFHARYPLRTGIPREELKSRLNLETSNYPRIIDQAGREGWIESDGGAISIFGFAPALTPDQDLQVRKIKDVFESNPYAPPSVKDVIAETGDELYMYLIEQKLLVRVSNDVVFSIKAYRTMVDKVRGMIEAASQVSVAEVRDEFHTSRKYALALMEHLDSIGVTQRRGDVRVLGRVSQED